MSEKWLFNPRGGTAVDLTGCEAGKETDGRCDLLLCKFRTKPEDAPDEERRVLGMLCPRDKEVEGYKESAVHLSPDSPLV